MLAAGGGVDVVTNVADIVSQIGVVTDAETDTAADAERGFGAGQFHPEVVAGDAVAAGFTGVPAQRSGAEKM